MSLSNNSVSHDLIKLESEWLSINPVIPTNEIVYSLQENNELLSKTGDGQKKYSELPFNQNYYTKSEVDTELDKKQDKIVGNDGDVLYTNGTSIFAQPIMKSGYPVCTTEDLEYCKNQSPSFADVFNKWQKFSHLNGKNNADTADLNGWSYNSEKDTIVQSRNSTSYTGFVSPKKYSNYDVTVRLYSTFAGDNDALGLVAAFATDSDGREHTLSFIAQPGGVGANARWVCILDYCQFFITYTNYNQKILVNKDSAIKLPSSSQPHWGSSTIGSGIVVNITRNGNIITGTCSQFNSTTLDSNTTITIDLDELSETNPTLELFKGSSPWGYSSFSQEQSMYENIAVSGLDDYIYDMVNFEVLEYNKSTKKWTKVRDLTPPEGIGPGRMSYNKLTGKLFYSDGVDVFQIGTNTNFDNE